MEMRNAMAVPVWKAWGFEFAGCLMHRELCKSSQLPDWQWGARGSSSLQLDWVQSHMSCCGPRSYSVHLSPPCPFILRDTDLLFSSPPYFSAQPLLLFLSWETLPPFSSLYTGALNSSVYMF